MSTGRQEVEALKEQLAEVHDMNQTLLRTVAHVAAERDALMGANRQIYAELDVEREGTRKARAERDALRTAGLALVDALLVFKRDDSSAAAHTAIFAPMYALRALVVT